jgi:hypothetical protein
VEVLLTGWRTAVGIDGTHAIALNVIIKSIAARACFMRAFPGLIVL